MKITVTSDCHCESRKDRGEGLLTRIQKIDTDCLIIAGDLCAYYQLGTMLERLAGSFEHVFFVHGNHEAWDSSLEQLHELCNGLESQISNLTFLNNKRVEYKGQGFVGGTMWYPKTEGDHEQFPDFYKIQGLNLEKVYEQNNLFSQALQSSQENDVIISHHLPHELSISEEFQGSDLNRFFLSDMDSFLRDNQRKLWVHGHTHSSFDYVVHGTRVICNPRGYESHDLNPEYHDIIIDLDKDFNVGNKQ